MRFEVVYLVSGNIANLEKKICLIEERENV